MTRLPDISDPSFKAALDAARDGITGPRPGSMAAMIEAFYQSPRWGEVKSESARRKYVLAFQRMMADLGEIPLDLLFIEHIEGHIATMADTPDTANRCLNCIRILFKWAVARRVAPHDPTEGVRYYKVSPEQEPWPMHQIVRFVEQARREVADAVALAYYTALRKSDVLRLGPEHVHGGHIVMQKTGGKATVVISEPCGEIIRRLRQPDDGPFLRTSHGKPWGRGFNTAFDREMKLLGMNGLGLTFHGLRRSGATLAKEAGATDEQITALLGHKDPRTQEKYTKLAKQDRAAKQAAGLIPRIG